MRVWVKIMKSVCLRPVCDRLHNTGAKQSHQAQIDIMRNYYESLAATVAAEYEDITC